MGMRKRGYVTFCNKKSRRMERMETEVTVVLKDVENAKRFVAESEKFKGDIDLLSGRYIVNAKSILGVLSLVLTEEMTAQIHTDDPEEINRFPEVMKQFEAGK